MDKELRGFLSPEELEALLPPNEHKVRNRAERTGGPVGPQTAELRDEVTRLEQAVLMLTVRLERLELGLSEQATGQEEIFAEPPVSHPTAVQTAAEEQVQTAPSASEPASLPSRMETHGRRKSAAKRKSPWFFR